MTDDYPIGIADTPPTIAATNQVRSPNRAPRLPRNLAYLRKLAKQIGGDNYTQFMRAYGLWQAGDAMGASELEAISKAILARTALKLDTTLQDFTLQPSDQASLAGAIVGVTKALSPPEKDKGGGMNIQINFASPAGERPQPIDIESIPEG